MPKPRHQRHCPLMALATSLPTLSASNDHCFAMLRYVVRNSVFPIVLDRLSAASANYSVVYWII
jgi:hypothetical protein